jgi:hypothetical protein
VRLFIPAPEVIMSNEKSSPLRECCDNGGYRCCFYGGWLRKASIQRNGETVVVYEQSAREPYVLPAGADAPLTLTQVEFSGDDLPRFTVVLDDPDHVVERIEVVLKESGIPSVGDDEPRVIYENTPIICPPDC